MTKALLALSQSISRVAAAAAPLLGAIRIGPNRHVTGLVCGAGYIVTVERALPVLDRYTVALPNADQQPARPGLRDPARNLALLHLDEGCAAPAMETAAAEPGALVVLVGAGADAAPTVRLSVIHRLLPTEDGPAAMLDRSGDSIEAGSLVLDAAVRLIGLAAPGPHGEAMAVPAAGIAAMLQVELSVTPPLRPASASRGWLGVALQPITVPDALVAQVGQSSARMVVSVTKGGPAQQAGLRAGDVLLSLDSTGATGPNALRAFLVAERIGASVEVRLLRDGAVLVTHLTVAAQPG